MAEPQKIKVGILNMEFNKNWRNPEFKVTVGGESLTFKELYDRAIIKSKEIFQKTNEVAERIPQDKYILYVDAVEKGTMGSENIDHIDEDRLKKVYEAETGSSQIDQENFQADNMRYCLGFNKGDERFQKINAFKESIPEDLSENCVGIVFSGSEVDMKDDEKKEHQKAIEKVQGLARQAKGLGIPMLGICFGGQMLAHTMKAEIDWVKNKAGGRERVVGLKQIKKTDTENPLLSDLPDNFTGAQNHGQEIVRKTLPKGSIVLAESESGALEIVLFEEEGRYFILCLQFHAEVGPTRLEMVQSGFGVEIARDEEIFSNEATKAREVLFPLFLQKVLKLHKESKELSYILSGISIPNR